VTEFGGAKPCIDIETDPDNCGTCGNVCGIVKLASEQVPTDIAVDATNVYWVNAATSTKEATLAKIPLGGGTAVTLATHDFGHIAIDATSVYATIPSEQKVLKISKSGGTPTVLASNEPGAALIAVDADNVYWTTYSSSVCPDQGPCIPDGAIKKAPKTGGAPKTIASQLENPGGLAVDGTNVYWTSPGSNYFQGAVYKVPLDGGTPVPLAAKETGVRDAIAISATNVYWVQTSLADGGGGSAIVTVPIEGGAITQVIASNGPLATDRTYLYFVDQYRIMKIPLAGGAPVTITIKGNLAPGALAVDATNVYWTNQRPYDGSIMTLNASSCTAGQCACPAGQTLCFGECVDLC
jgi:hypothetical protein